MRLLTNEERIIQLTQKSDAQGGLSPEDMDELNQLITDHLRSGNVSAEEVKGSNGVVSDEKAGKLASAWQCTVGMAKKVWNAIWSFLCSIGRGIKDGFKKLFSRKPKAVVDNVRAYWQGLGEQRMKAYDKEQVA